MKVELCVTRSTGIEVFVEIHKLYNLMDSQSAFCKKSSAPSTCTKGLVADVESLHIWQTSWPSAPSLSFSKEIELVLSSCP